MFSWNTLKGKEPSPVGALSSIKVTKLGVFRFRLKLQIDNAPAVTAIHHSSFCPTVPPSSSCPVSIPCNSIRSEEEGIMSSAYENVVGGKLKLKGKALDVKAASGIRKKKNKKNKQLENDSKNHQLTEHFDDDHETAAAAKDNDLLSAGGSTEELTDPSQEEEVGDASKSAGENVARWDDHLTPAERRYVEQRAKIDMHKLAKTANKSHRDRIQDFNQYLANMSEHYDIPKVGPG